MRLVLDACVIYPTVLREILIGGAGRFYTPLWSDRILEEWARATRKLGPLAEVQARGEVATLKAAWPDACVEPRAGDMARLYLPDEDDVHVLAAAIAGSADGIVTFNAKDFPRATLRDEGVERFSPDDVLMQFWLESSAEVEAVVARVHAQAEAMSGEEIPPRAVLKRARVPRLGKAIYA